MHIEKKNHKLRYNQAIITWKWLHQQPITELVAHGSARMTFCHVHLFFNSSSLQEDIYLNYLSKTMHTSS